MSSAIEAGVSTMYVWQLSLFICRWTLPYSFVGLGEDPQVLAIRAPALFAVSPLSILLIIAVGNSTLPARWLQKPTQTSWQECRVMDDINDDLR